MFGRKRLRRENAFLIEQLAWYADSSNWRRRATNAKGEPVKWIKAHTSFDRGARAKFALTQVGAPFLVRPAQVRAVWKDTGAPTVQSDED